MTNIPNPPLIGGIAAIASSYKAILCDVWGVVHNGVHAYESAADALTRFREGGGRVVLVTNAPRPKEMVVKTLDGLGVPRTAYDDIVTSGDTARSAIEARPGSRIFYIGPDKDLPAYDDIGVTFTGEEDCDLIACAGLFDDETETPESYRDLFGRLIARGIPMVCLNPDLVVERGERLVWCSGALAQLYMELGGTADVIGKPYAPIYEKALSIAGSLVDGPLQREAVLAIGDGIDTDVRGAFGQGIDVLFITAGIHNELFGERLAPDMAAVHAFLAEKGLSARAAIPHLAWQAG